MKCKPDGIDEEVGVVVVKFQQRLQLPDTPFNVAGPGVHVIKLFFDNLRIFVERLSLASLFSPA